MAIKGKYENIKSMLNIYDKRNTNRKELENINLTRDQIGRIITILNNMKILENKGLEKGNNELRNDLYNKNIFDSKDFNIALLASLAYSEEENAEKVVEYIFKTIIKNMTFSIANRYSRSFQKNIKELIDVKKYSQFLRIIKENSKNNFEKIICEIRFINPFNIQSIVPLEFFIFNDSWFICAYFLNSKTVGIIDSRNIESEIPRKGYLKEYINFDNVEKIIKEYIINENKKNEELTMLRLNPETLSLLIEFGLLIQDEYELFEDNKENEDRLFFLNETILSRKLNRINIDQINSSLDIEEKIIYNKKVNFYEDDTNKCIVKAKLTKNKLNFILSFFDNVELLK